ncbi:MAG TPA: sensor histidine kinase [Jatrophihabitantaceae bacterium]
MSNATPTLAALRHARAQQAVVWRWLRLVGPVVITLQIAGLIASAPHPGLHGKGLAVTISIAVFAVGAYGTFATRTGPDSARTVFLGVLIVGSIALLRIQPDGPGVLGLFVAVALVARRVPMRVGAGLVGVLAVLVPVGALAVHGRRPFTGLMTAIAMASFYAVTRLAVRLGQTNNQAEQLLIELERSRDAQARAAALAERQRLAREMHDILAHSLSGLILQLEGARLMASGDRVDERLPATIDRAHHLAKSGLDEARHAIKTLRDETLLGPDELPALTAQFEHDSGIRCELTVVGDRRPLSTEARLAVYRVTQESLTNVAKHAHADHVEVRLAYGADDARLVVENFGAGAAPGRTEGSGYGLTGMRERAELLGGRLCASATPHGFRVELAVPA